MKTTILTPESKDLDLKEYQFALEMCNTSIKKHPNEPEVYALRANAKSILKGHKGAAEDYGLAIALDPENPRYFYKNSIEKSYLMDYDGAKADINRAIALHPCFASSHLVKGIRCCFR